MLTRKIDDEIELRLLQKNDAEELFALVDSCRPYLREWLPWVDANTSSDKTYNFISASLDHYSNGDGFNAGIWYKDQIAGVIGFHKTDRANRKTSIGYWLGEQFQGNGIMIRACQALLDYMFSETSLNRVEILCAVKNEKSQMIPKNLNFTREGILRQREWLYDHFVDLVLYSILANEWKLNWQSK